MFQWEQRYSAKSSFWLHLVVTNVYIYLSFACIYVMLLSQTGNLPSAPA